MGTIVELAPGAETEIVILFGDADGPEQAAALIARYRDADLDAVLAEVREQWEELLGTVQVKTPDRSMDIMLNGWLLYQTIACRLWARSGFYQASGAYGFRDQLQDGMALAAIRPSLTREHLVRAAGRQFAEGDVQHWWLPHSGQGVRTRISDDRLWLAFCVAHYLDATGDASLLDETIPFLEGPKLKEEEHDSFFTPTVSDRTASVYEHCALALDASLARGAHGLPLIGGGDWNDGMNRVGEGGKGESVWLAWLSHMSLTAFAALAKARGEPARASKWRDHASALQKSLEREAWDGGWYRRAWFDDGTAIGSAASDECRIDSIAQSWAVMSGVARPERASRAMAAVERELIRSDDGLALLFTPPFDRTAHDPGYIKGYPPGIRENGGQYTHGAIWSVIAFARLGEGAKAAGLFSHAQSDQPRPHPLGPAPLQGRALCRRRRHLFRGGSSRPWRLDLVYGLGRLAVSRRNGRDIGSAPDRLGAPSRSLHSGELAGLRGHAPPRFDPIRHPRRQSRRCRKGDRIGADRRNRGHRAAAPVRSARGRREP